MPEADNVVEPGNFLDQLVPCGACGLLEVARCGLVLLPKDPSWSFEAQFFAGHDVFFELRDRLVLDLLLLGLTHFGI